MQRGPPPSPGYTEAAITFPSAPAHPASLLVPRGYDCPCRLAVCGRARPQQACHQHSTSHAAEPPAAAVHLTSGHQCSSGGDMRAGTTQHTSMTAQPRCSIKKQIHTHRWPTSVHFGSGMQCKACTKPARQVEIADCFMCMTSDDSP